MVVEDLVAGPLWRPFLIVSGPGRPEKGRQRPQLDCCAYNVTTTVSMSWEGFSCCRKFFICRRNVFYVVGRTPSRVGGYPGVRGSPWTLRIYFADGSVCVCVR